MSNVLNFFVNFGFARISLDSYIFNPRKNVGKFFISFISSSVARTQSEPEKSELLTARSEKALPETGSD